MCRACRCGPDLLIAFAARNSAVYFTKWYPEYRKAKYGTPPASALPGTH